jgi:hypothetical protein
MPAAEATACEANMLRIYVCSLVVLLNVLLVLLIISAVRGLNFDDGSTSAGAPALASKKFEERAPAGDLRNQSSRSLQARPAAKTGPGVTMLAGKARRGLTGTWNHDGSIMRLEAIGRARRFYYAEVPGAVPARSGDIAFEGVREGPTFSGRAFQFAQNCAPLGYLVKGSVTADEATVKMEGRKPHRDAQCNIVSYANEVLVFNLTNKL